MSFLHFQQCTISTAKIKTEGSLCMEQALLFITKIIWWQILCLVASNFLKVWFRTETFSVWCLTHTTLVSHKKNSNIAYNDGGFMEDRKRMEKENILLEYEYCWQGFLGQYFGIFLLFGKFRKTIISYQ